MKIKAILTIKTTSKIMLFATLFSVAACNLKQDNSDTIQNKTVSETKVKPPSVDIYTATLTGNLNAVKQHINANTDLNKPDNYGSSPLAIAATFGKTEVAIALIEAGVELNNQNAEGSTPLHTAAFFCRTEIVKALLAKGADKSIKNKYGSTALESISGPFDMVKPIYDQISKDLGPLGFKLDYDQIKETRPVIATMLK